MLEVESDYQGVSGSAEGLEKNPKTNTVVVLA